MSRLGAKLEETLHTQKFKNPYQKAVLNVMHTAYELKSRINGALKAYGLTPEQYNVLRILNGKYPEKMCVRDIARRMIERSSNVPRIIDRLEYKQLVKRTTSSLDKRETVITLAAAGIQILDTVNPLIEKLNKDMCGLDEQELICLNQLLDKYRQF